jgi:competence protein ComEA
MTKSVVPLSGLSVAVAVLMVSAWTGFVPVAHAQQKKSEATDATVHSKGKVDINSADVKALETLPGVGPAIAQRIVDSRPYHSLADLEKVKGLSKTKVEALKDEVTFGTHHSAKREKSSSPAKTEEASSPAEPAASKPARTTSAEPATPPAVSHSAAAASGKLAPGEKININTATAEELDRLPGIGPTKAKAIIDYRNQNGDFKTLEDIQKVKGIKTAEFSKLKDFIKLRN